MSGPVTDPKLIAQLEQSQQAGDEPIVQALIDGRMSFPRDSRALNKPYWQALVARVAARDPTFDTVDYNARSRTRQAFTSGKQGDNISSFNTVLHHIGTLQQAADDLGNHGGLATPLNAPGNAILETFGSDRPTNFRTARKAVADEAVRAFRGVGGTGNDVQAVLDNLSENASPEQIRGSLRTLANLLKGRITSLGEQYARGMGKTSDGINLLDPEAQRVLQSLTPDERRGGGPPSGAPGVTVGSGPPPADPNTPRPGDDETDTLVAGDVVRDQSVANPVHLTDAQRQAVVDLATHGGSTDEMIGLLRGFGLNLSNADQREVIRRRLEAVRADPSKAGELFQVSVDNSVHPIAPAETAGVGEGGASFIGGIASNIPFARELAAVGSTVANGGTYEENLNRIKGERLWEEQNHPWLYGTGAVIGALPAGGAEIGGARAAASAAGRAALREGLPMAAARTAANRAFASRTAIDAAAQSGLYSLGNADGSLTDRLGQGAVGAGIGAVTGGTLALGGGTVARAMQVRAGRLASEPPVISEGQRAFAAAERQGITPFAADVGGAPTRMATSGAAQTIGGVGPIRRAAQATVDSAEAVRDRVATAIGTPVDNLTAGEVATAGAHAYTERTSQLGGRFYREAERQAGGARVATPDALRILDQEIGTLQQTPGGQAPLARLQGLRRALATPSSVTGLRNMRTVLRDEFESAGLRFSNEERVANRVIDAASDDIVNGLRAQGRQGAADAYRAADNYWRQRLATIDQHLEPIIGGRDGKSGEEVMRSLNSAMAGNNRRFVGFLNALPAPEQGIVRASLIQRLGQAARGQQDEGGEVFSLASFLTHWNSIGGRAKDRLFGSEGRAALNDLATYAAGSKQAQKFANHSNTGAAVTTTGLATGLSLGPVAWLTAAKVLAVSYGAGRLLASPRFARWLARPPRTAEPAAVRVYVDRLSHIARAEPAIANDILGLQQRLVAAFETTPVRAAADERGDHRAGADGNQVQQESQSGNLQPAHAGSIP